MKPWDVKITENEKNVAIVEKGGTLYYTENGEPVHRGVVEVNGEIYYAGKDGKIITNAIHVVHSSMSNDLLRHGAYEFDEKGRVIPESYIAPRERSHKKKRSKSKINFKALKIPVGVALAAVLLVGGAIVAIKSYRNPPSVKSSEASDYMDETAPFELPQPDSAVYLCSNDLEKYYLGDLTFDQLKNSAEPPYKAYSFNYDLKEQATLEIDGKSYNMPPEAKSVQIDNLQTDTLYDYTIIALGDTYTGTLRTAPSNRFIKLDGAVNTRDIGGYTTAYNHAVKQNLLIRGSELDGLVESSYKLKDQAAAQAFGFKLDMDLRDSYTYEGDDYVSPLGSDVTHRFYNAPQYNDIFNEESHESLRQIFSDLADRSNYPVYMHCTYGADRTGTVVYLLQGILGVSEDNMEFEYRLTGFLDKGYFDNSSIDQLKAELETYRGENLNEKIEDFLITDVGITHDQIKTIRNIFLP